jgi:hypothetical protein
LIGDQPAEADFHMEGDFLETLGSDLTVPGDFNWVSCLICFFYRFYF